VTDKTTIQTYSGLRFDLADPKPEMFNIVDIAHALSQLCRFTGHTRFHYSVGQHSVVVASLLLERSPEIALEGLMHDAAEAYIGDVSYPLKALIKRQSTVYKEITESIERVLADRFGLKYPWPLEIHEVDHMALAIERRDVMNPSADVTWRGLPDAPGNITIPKNKQKVVEKAFMELFQRLSSQRAKTRALPPSLPEIVIPKGTSEEGLKKFFPWLN
jgi:uncharacterized protein